MRVAYDRAAKHLPAQASKLSLNATIAPVWIKGQDKFVYRRQLAGQAKEFVLIDANANSSDVAFDHERLAAAITTKGQVPVDPRRLPFDRVEVTPQTLEFQWNQDLDVHLA